MNIRVTENAEGMKNSGNKWKNHFFKMKGGYRDGLKHQKGRNEKH